MHERSDENRWWKWIWCYAHQEKNAWETRLSSFKIEVWCFISAGCYSTDHQLTYYGVFCIDQQLLVQDEQLEYLWTYQYILGVYATCYSSIWTLFHSSDYSYDTWNQCFGVLIIHLCWVQVVQFSLSLVLLHFCHSHIQLRAHFSWSSSYPTVEVTCLEHISVERHYKLIKALYKILSIWKLQAH